MPLDYPTLKKIASRAGLSPSEILALAPQNDPFYVGAKGQLEKGRWFASIYKAMGSPARCHTRRVHYWLVTTNAVPKPNGKPYENTQNDWSLLCLAAKYARYLGLVPIENIIDRRNPEPIVNAHHWQHQKASKIKDSIDESNIIESIVEQFVCFNPTQTQPYMVECWCFPAETEVQTICGPKPISTIQIGDMVLTHRGRYRPVVNTMQREYSGELVSIHSRYSPKPVRMTPNHRILTAVGRTKGILDNSILHPEWLPSERLSDLRMKNHYNGDYVAFPRLKQEITEVGSIYPDNTRMGRANGSGARPKEINTVLIDPEVAWMLGYFVGNGFVGQRSLTFTLNAKDTHHADRLMEIGRRFGIEPTKSIYSKTAKVKYNATRLCQWFKDQFGGESLGRSHTGSWNKRIPLWAIQGPDDICLSFFKGLWDADGTEHSKGHKSIVTCSKNVASGIRLILTRFGESPRMCITKDNHTLISWGGGFSWGVQTDQYLWCPLRSIHREEYNGIVYNIEVEEDNSYVTEFVVHNCEKSTMNDVLEPLCQKYGMNLVTGLGELSITAVYLLALRVVEAKKPVRILYISDFDPAGESMPLAVSRKIEYFVRNYSLDCDIKLVPLMLTSQQCVEYNLPRTPIKETEKRKDKFENRHGVGATELDAMEALHPGEMAELIEKAIEPYFDIKAWNAATQKNREVQQKVREYLIGGDCPDCENGVIHTVRGCPGCNGLGENKSENPCKTCGGKGVVEKDFDCVRCLGTGSIPGKIGTDILADLNTSEFDSYSPPKVEPHDDAKRANWLYDASLDYLPQIERYREHKTQGSEGSESVDQIDIDGDLDMDYRDPFGD